MKRKKVKERLFAILVAVAAAVTMLPAGMMYSAESADAASTITLTGKKFEYKDAYGDWHTNTYFSGSGYEGLCAKAHYHSITGKHSYTMHDSANYCKDNIMAKLCYHYGHVKGWTGGTNGAKLARCLSYVSTQSGAKDKGKAFNFKEKTLKEMVETAKKVKVPEGFACWFVIPTGDTSRQAAVIWKYTPPGSLTLVKSSAVTGYQKSRAGCEYTVYKSDKKTTVGKLTCKADGSTGTLSLPPGTYYVKETKTNANYLLNSQWYTAKVTSKKTVKVKASDSAQGSFSLEKAFTPDSDDGYTLEGFRFTLQSTADSKLRYTGTTDAAGKLSIAKLKAGTYTVTEELTEAQQEAGYGNESKQGQKITIENGKTTQITWKNSYVKSNQLVIAKTTDDGSPVDGFRFDITGDLTGRPLTADTFLSYANITPVTVKDGFTLGEFCVNEEELEALNDAARSKETGDCTVHVTAEAAGPEAPPPGRLLEDFQNGEDSYAFAEGDALEYEGILYIAQSERSYNMDQIRGTGGEECLLDDESFFKVYEAEETTEVITVPIKVTLRSVKEQDQITDPVSPAAVSEPEGWTIQYNNIVWAGSADSYHKNDEETQTGENGIIRIGDLLPGTYTVKEELTEEQAARFRQPAVQTKVLEDGRDSGPLLFSFENKAKTTQVSLMKTSTANDGEIAGFEFTLTGTRNFDGAPIEPVTAVTEEDGRIDFGELYPGSYVMEETGFDPSVYVFHDAYRLEGYENPAKAFVVTGEEEAPIEIAFENDPITTLLLTKVDSETQMFLDGAAFDLYEDGKKTVTFRLARDEAGAANLEILWRADGSVITAGTGDVETASRAEDETAAADTAGEEVLEGDGENDADTADESAAGEEGVAYNFAALRGLKRNGSYRIVETKAPAGYAGTVDYRFTFEENMDPIILENTAPEISTEAKDAAAGLHMSNAQGEPVTIVDTVRYRNLTPGKTYSMTGRLVFRPDVQAEAEVSAEDAMPVKAGGRAVEKTVLFMPSEPNGSVDVPLTFDASALAGAKTVIYESLRDPQLAAEDSVIATHAEADNEDQSIYFPALRTTARGEDTGMHITYADENTVILDTVDYSNVMAGRVYEIRGTLIDQKTGKAVTEGGENVTASVRFKATADGPVFEDDAAFAEEAQSEKEGAENDTAAGSTDHIQLVSGSVELRFAFDGRQYAGTSLVAFEELRTEGKLVGQHKDIGDKAQTVRTAAIGTKASVAGNTIKDQVKYENLIPGKTYRMVGVLMDKATGKAAVLNGHKLRSELEFTPSKPRGKVTLAFRTDTSKLKGRTLVAFETCYIMVRSGDAAEEGVKEGPKPVQIAAHRRLDARSQTVTLGSPRTGQDEPWFLWCLLAASGALLAGAGCLLRRMI